MIDAFRHALRQETLFCRQCQGVHPHRLLSRSALFAPQAPIVAICPHCQTPQFLFAYELSCLVASHDKDKTFKIAGRSRISMGDRLYIPGKPMPCTVKSRFRVGENECFVVQFDDGTESKNVIASGESTEGFKLLPFQAGQCRIGDPVYHVQRHLFGVTVGVLYGKETKLVVRLENQVTLLIALPESRNVPSNRAILEWASPIVRAVAGEAPKLRLDVGQGILYLTGQVAKYSMIRRMVERMQTMPGLRGIVQMLKANPHHKMDDDTLAIIAQEAILRSGAPVFNLEINCVEGSLVISGFCRRESARLEVLEAVETIEGIVDLNIELSLRPIADLEDKERSNAVAKALRKHATFRGALIKVSSMDGIVRLEGCVHSTLQKNTATLAAVWAGKNLRVENHLKVVRLAHPQSASILSV